MRAWILALLMALIVMFNWCLRLPGQSLPKDGSCDVPVDPSLTPPGPWNP